ncbi:uncharacterized protein At4g38062 isoform X1 [Ziziphus jujuba]|uniref:Uncharacterized protein At4g38062 isoform X1 n=4 Tax=Ziziphus jujuba TaxID=326968 RepID=A0A6P4AWN0_ZIZJJ|nr:uncharacterized protein At4g38062 isoform X1 [Ziziphus jujuba]XP_024932669.3 uncharacterized protein At4g38062 isoform X1 [Ziziphus jujuba]XP_024932671.3 uncharacterized protein At4g38062 isoform X1 [Ziziphus jujuba]XP_048335864.2 uncharacterized protein At4g38062 isoform X1 [Ziziphus jujuba]
MDKVYEELDEAKAEIEKLRAEYRGKTEAYENLKKAHNEQLINVQDANLKFQKQVQELNEKADENSVLKQMCDDLQSSLNEKESTVKHLRTLYDKLRVDCDEKFRTWEEEKRGLLSALDEANEKNFDHEQQIHGYKEEIESLKRCLAVSQKKCLEAEKKANATKEVRDGDDMLLQLEDENRKIEDQLKWKKEQFAHLEEAHEKMRDQFRESMKEWELEKSSLLEEIGSLQTSLDSQISISEDLQNQIKMLNQALAHEESRRKRLEVQVSEYSTQLENVSGEYHDAKSELGCLTSPRDKEIVSLRNLLAQKETSYKEMEYQAGKLEQENQELRISLKELQEARIQEASAVSSLAKLRNKLKSLEQMHKETTANIGVKEAEWSSQLEKMTEDLNNQRSRLESKDAYIEKLRMELKHMHGDSAENLRANEAESVQLESLITDLNNYKSDLEKREATIAELRMKLEQMHGDSTADSRDIEPEWKSNQLEKLTGDLNKYRFELENKDAVIKELRTELEGCHSSNIQLKLQNEEISMMLLVFQLGISEAQLKIAKEITEMTRTDKENEEKIYLLMQQLEMRNSPLVRLQTDLEEEHEKATSLLQKIDSLDLNGNQKLLMPNEVDRYEEMLMESSMRELFLKEHLFELATALEKKHRKVCDDLDRINTELAEKICDGNEIEFELYIWKSIAERLKVDLEENNEKRKGLEASLLAQIDVGEIIKQEKECLVHVLEEKDKTIENLHQKIGLLEQKLKSRDIGAETTKWEVDISSESEKASFLQITREKDEILGQLQKEVGWLEQESLRRELEGFLLAQIGAETTFEHEKETLIQLVEQKNQRVSDIMHLAKSSENKFNSSLISLSSQLAEKQTEIDLVHEAWEKIAAAEIMAALEIEEKKLMVLELEDDINNIKEKMELQKKSLCDSEQQALKVEEKLEAKELEMKTLTDQMNTKLINADAEIEELKSERRNLIEDVIKLSSERENLLGFIGGLGDRISGLSSTDKQLMDMLEGIMLSFDNSGCSEREMKMGNPIRKSVDAPVAMKRIEAVSDVRAPFREINN